MIDCQIPVLSKRIVRLWADILAYFVESNIAALRAEFKKLDAGVVQSMGQESELVKRCMDAGYNFEFQILDMNKKNISVLYLTPSDYR